MQDSFRFMLPMDIVKSETADTDTEMRIGGYASTSDEDRQGDEIIQKGIDYSDFVNFGFFNYDHNSDKVIGYPDKSKCKIDSKGFYVEGTLLKGVELAERVWETAVALQKANAPRRLGFSVEGKVLKRDDLGKIVKAKIYHVAITSTPVNAHATFEALCKSFTNDPKELEKAEALEAGHGDSNGSPLVRESLDSAFKTLSYAVGDDEESKKCMAILKDRLLSKSNISKSELILYLQLVKGVSLDTARRISSEILTEV